MKNLTKTIFTLALIFASYAGFAAGSISFTGPTKVELGATVEYTFSFSHPSPRYAQLYVSGGTFVEPYESKSITTGSGTRKMKIRWDNAVTAGKVNVISIINTNSPSGGSGPSTSLTVNVMTLINPSISISGNPSTLCAETSYRFLSNSPGWTTYEWQVVNDYNTSTFQSSQHYTDVLTDGSVNKVEVKVRAYSASRGWTPWSTISRNGDTRTPATRVLLGTDRLYVGEEVTYSLSGTSAWQKWFTLGSYRPGLDITGEIYDRSTTVKANSDLKESYILAYYRECNRNGLAYKRVVLDETTPVASIKFSGDKNNLKPSTSYVFESFGDAYQYDWAVTGDASLVSTSGNKVTIRTHSTGNFSNARISLRTRNHGDWSLYAYANISVDSKVPNVRLSGSAYRDYCNNRSYKVSVTGDALEYDWDISGNGRITSTRSNYVWIKSNSSGSGDIEVRVRGRRYAGWSSWDEVEFDKCGECSNGQSISVTDGNGNYNLCWSCPATPVKINGPNAENYTWSITNGTFAHPDGPNSCSNYTVATYLNGDWKTILARGSSTSSLKKPFISVSARYCDGETKFASHQFESLYCTGKLGEPEIANASHQEEAQVWPNPAVVGDVVTLSLEGLESAQVRNLMGNVENVEVSVSEGKVMINTADLSKGTYYVTYMTKNGGGSEQLRVE